MPVETVYGLSSLEVDWFLGTHLFIQFFIHSFNEYDFSTFHILDTVLGTEYSTMNKTDICPLLSLKFGPVLLYAGRVSLVRCDSLFTLQR